MRAHIQLLAICHNYLLSVPDNSWILEASAPCKQILRLSGCADCSRHRVVVISVLWRVRSHWFSVLKLSTVLRVRVTTSKFLCIGTGTRHFPLVFFPHNPTECFSMSPYSWGTRPCGYGSVFTFVSTWYWPLFLSPGNIFIFLSWSLWLLIFLFFFLFLWHFLVLPYLK